jgi:hypothetical protein
MLFSCPLLSSPTSGSGRIREYVRVGFATGAIVPDLDEICSLTLGHTLANVRRPGTVGPEEELE